MKVSQHSETYFDVVRKIWSGKTLSPLFNEDMSVGQVSLFVLGLNPHKVIQISDTTNEQLTCQDIAQLGVKAAQNLKLKLGIQQGDVIGIVGRNTNYLTPVVLGAFLIGAPISPFHHILDKNTVKHVYGLTRPKLILCDEDVYHTLFEGLKEIGLSCLIYILKGHIEGVPNVQDLLQDTYAESDNMSISLQKGGDLIAAILCSSGTTGLPKGVCISHQSLLCRHDFSFIEPDDVLFTFSTLHWISGLFFLVKSLVTGALRIITEEPFSSELCLRIIEKYKVTSMIGPPSYACQVIQTPNISRRQLASVRNYICGGSAISVTVARKMQDLLRSNAFNEAYGLTELEGISNLNKWPYKKEGSVGRLNPNTEARILTEDGEPLGVNEEGEIHLRSIYSYNWKGYYANADMTRTTIDADGWIRTGDLGHFDEDGFLYVCGRQKEILKYNNFQISPSEIEEQIMRLPGVVEVCVFGIPDPIACDLPAAAIIKSSDCYLTEEDVSKKVSSCLSEAKHLHGGVYFLNELPKTPSGKIQRNKLLSIVRNSVAKEG